MCQGPDCFGAGGGAALLALEDWLVDAAVVAGGGCRNRCSMGPNVYVSPNGVKEREEQEHFSRVTSLADCRNVLRRCAANESSCDNHDDSGSNSSNTRTATVSPVLVKLRQRRADQKHWQALRLLARIRKSPVHVSSQQRETACAAVEQAVSVVDGANEQQQRLKGVLERILEENAQLSSSSESEGDSDEEKAV